MSPPTLPLQAPGVARTGMPYNSLPPSPFRRTTGPSLPGLPGVSGRPNPPRSGAVPDQMAKQVEGVALHLPPRTKSDYRTRQGPRGLSLRQPQRCLQALVKLL
jgi:hypothetical protein